MSHRDFYEDVVVLDRVTTNDPLAGVQVEWVDGATISVGISTNNSTAAQIAYQSGAKVLYTVVMELDEILTINDRIRRVRDGTVLVLKSDPNDMRTPETADEKYKQARAEAIRV